MIQDAGFLKTLNSVTQPRKCATGISRFFRIAMVMVTAGNQCWVTPGRAEPEAATGTQDGTTQRADREGSRVKVKLSRISLRKRGANRTPFLMLWIINSGGCLRGPHNINSL